MPRDVCWSIEIHPIAIAFREVKHSVLIRGGQVKMSQVAEFTVVCFNLEVPSSEDAVDQSCLIRTKTLLQLLLSLLRLALGLLGKYYFAWSLI